MDDNWVKIPTIQPIKINKNIIAIGESEPTVVIKNLATGKETVIKKSESKTPKRKRARIRVKKVWLPKCIRADPLIKMLFS